jgi:hypothetical protein
MQCKICKKEFKRLTATHVKTHGMTLDEYYEKYEKEKFIEKQIIELINDYYITVRYRFIEYMNGSCYTVKKSDTRSWGLCDNDIKQHLQGSKAIGIYFPANFSKFIGLDIDCLDISILNETYKTIINYGIPKNCIMMSYSGNKGYHLDIFIDKVVDKAIITKFYEVLLGDMDISKDVIELRGGGDQGYKIPFGFHYKTGNYCYPCDEHGQEIEIGDLKSLKKLEAQIIGDIVEINYSNNIDANLVMEFEELNSTIEMLPIYHKTNGNRIKKVETLLSEGVQEVGSRHNSILLLASYYKDIKNYCISETMDHIQSWINDTWNQSIVDQEVHNNIKATVKNIYNSGFRFNVQANQISVSLPEIKEIFSVETNNKLQTESLRRLYYCFMLHSKAYASEDGTFYMTYKQLGTMGCTLDTNNLSKQIDMLEKLGKLIVVERARNNTEKRNNKKPNKYKLPCFINYEKKIKVFTICDEKKLCKDCLYRAICFLAENKIERRKFIKNKKYKNLAECPYNH